MLERCPQSHFKTSAVSRFRAIAISSFSLMSGSSDSFPPLGSWCKEYSVGAKFIVHPCYSPTLKIVGFQNSF